MGLFGDKTGPQRRRSQFGSQSFIEHESSQRHWQKQNNRSGIDYDDDFDGPLKKRSCTDVLCLIFFAAFIVLMLVAFIYGLVYGDLDRLTQGYDVSGNVCGKDNDKIDKVAFSGLNLEKNSYLYFDLVKTAQILGAEALAEVQRRLPDVSLPNMKNTADKLAFCHGDSVASGGGDAATTTATTSAATTAAPTASALHDDDGRGVVLKQLMHQLDAVEIAREHESENVSYTALLTGRGQVKVFRLARARQSPDGNDTTFRTSAAMSTTSTSAQVATELATVDPISQAVTGGGSCRYCVEDCPEGTKAVFSRCLPKDVEEQASFFYSGSGMSDVLNDIVADIKISWKELVYMSLIALGFSILVVILFRFLAGVIVYVILVLAVLAFLGGTAFLWTIWFLKHSYYNENKHKANSTRDPGENVLNTTAEEVKIRLTRAYSQSEVNWYLVGAIVASVATIVLLLLIFVLWKRIGLVIQLFKEAGKAVAAMPFIVLQPIWTFLALLICVVVWVLGMFVIESAGEPVQHADTGFVTYEKDTFLHIMRWAYFFGLLWITQFVIACQHVVVAGAIATWYFSKTKKSLGLPLVSSLLRLVRYHLGSVAFGSFIIALFKFVRAVLKFVEKRLKKYAGDTFLGKCMGGCLKCCQCCLFCFEKVIQYLNKNAYIEIAIYGHSFCKAAREAFALLASNALRVAVINSVGAFVLFLGKLIVIVATVMIGIEIMEEKDPAEDGRLVQFVWIPVFLAAILAYLIADCFIAIYGMAIDCIFLCFCEDSKRNDGVSKPYFMSKGLMEFVDNSKKALEAEKERERIKKASKAHGRQILVSAEY